MDIIPNMETPSYLPLLDFRPLHVYMIHPQGAFHIELCYLEFLSYSYACNSIKNYWTNNLYEVPPDNPVILTNSLGAVIHQNSWNSFAATRRPCLAWYGSSSIRRLLGEINTKKQLLGRHLSQLNVTEAVAYFAQESGNEQDVVPEIVEEEEGGSVLGDLLEDGPLVRQWDLLDHVESGGYAEVVQEAEDPGVLGRVFVQDEGLEESLAVSLSSVEVEEEAEEASRGWFKMESGDEDDGDFEWPIIAIER